eukprot:TRINITY_DN17626_c0_g1_i1.p2 TRINITY_DN17626_c0_g1~~TRINITY_DN17626_c0_g1_i1.p2  ORF type:complete len:139 (+),score=51.12 TRINITY_DN17626_c0_g1_i1:429-845(+)
MAAITEEEDAGQLKLGEDFEDVKCLMNFEVEAMLNKKKEQYGEEMMNNQVFAKSMEYVERFRQYKNKETVNQLREKLEKDHKLKQFEVCVIGNLNPGTVEEMKCLVPSLAMETREPHPLSDDEIQQILDDIQMLKKFE